MGGEACPPSFADVDAQQTQFVDVDDMPTQFVDVDDAPTQLFVAKDMPVQHDRVDSIPTLPDAMGAGKTVRTVRKEVSPIVLDDVDETETHVEVDATILKLLESVTQSTDDRVGTPRRVLSQEIGRYSAGMGLRCAVQIVCEVIWRITDFSLWSRVLASRNLEILQNGMTSLLPEKLLCRDEDVLSVYWAPEVLRSESVQGDERAVVFSLGVILHEVMTGRLPFAGGRALGRDRGIIKLHTRFRDYFNGVNRLFKRALAWDPEKRFQTLDDFRRALGCYQNYGF